MFKKLFFSTALGLAMMIFTFSPKVIKAEVFNYESLTSDNIDYSALHNEYLNGNIDYDAVKATISNIDDDNIDYDALYTALGAEVVDHDPTKPVAVEFATDKEAFLAFLEDEKEWSEFEEEYYFYASDDGHVIESTVPLDEELVQNYFYAEDSGDTLQRHNQYYPLAKE